VDFLTLFQFSTRIREMAYRCRLLSIMDAPCTILLALSCWYDHVRVVLCAWRLCVRTSQSGPGSMSATSTDLWSLRLASQLMARRSWADMSFPYWPGAGLCFSRLNPTGFPKQMPSFHPYRSRIGQQPSDENVIRRFKLTLRGLEKPVTVSRPEVRRR
jgi:hypothetical protein